MRADGSLAQPLPLEIVVPLGRAVLSQGESPPEPWVVGSGALLESCVSEDGRVLGLGVLGPGELVGEPGGRPSPVTVRALRHSRLRPAGQIELTDLLADRERRRLELAFALACQGVAERLDNLLCDLSDRFGRPVPGGLRLDLGLRQEDLAALTGATRESVNRTLGSLARSGRVSIVGRGRYVVRTGLELVGS